MTAARPEGACPGRRAPLAGALLGVGVFFWAAFLALAPFESHDLWWHLRAGEETLRLGRPPRENLFSFTAPHHPWVTHEWLSEVAFHWIYVHAGPGALVALKALLVGAAFALVYLTARRESGSIWASAIAAAAGAYAARFTFDIRPQLFTYVGLALLLGVARRAREEGGRPLFALVPLVWVWANLHSGFIAGLAVLVLAAVTMPRRAPVVLPALAGCAAVALLTPSGWRGVWFPVEVSRTRLFTDTLTEWFSPNFQSSWLWGFEGMLLALFLVLALAPIRARAFDLALIVAFGHLALQHQRHVPLFAIAAAPVLARHLAAAAARRLPEIPAAWEAWAALALAGGTLALLVSGVPRRDAFAATVQRSAFPVGAADYLERQAPLRVYNSYKWGGYLIWRLYPRQRVFMDGRADAYPLQVFQDYLAVERLHPGWRGVLNRYRIDAVVYHRGSALAAALEADAEWRRVHSDAVAEVFVRRQTRP